MGTNKLTLPRVGTNAGKTVLEHVVDVCVGVCEEVWLLTPPSSDEITGLRFSAVRCFEDEDFYQGPLVALAHAWEQILLDGTVSSVLVVAGDLPGLDREVLTACVGKMDGALGTVDAVLVEREGWPQPLLGCYRAIAGQAFIAGARQGGHRIFPAIAALETVTIASEAAGWPMWWTRPVHTPDDYCEWLHFVSQDGRTEP